MSRRFLQRIIVWTLIPQFILPVTTLQAQTPQATSEDLPAALRALEAYSIELKPGGDDRAEAEAIQEVAGLPRSAVEDPATPPKGVDLENKSRLIARLLTLGQHRDLYQMIKD